MHNLPNIEKLTGRDYYTGYTTGAIYHIRNVKGLSAPGVVWRGTAIKLTNDGKSLPIITGRTLAEISAQLAKV